MIWVSERVHAVRWAVVALSAWAENATERGLSSIVSIWMITREPSVAMRLLSSSPQPWLKWPRKKHALSLSSKVNGQRLEGVGVAAGGFVGVASAQSVRDLLTAVISSLMATTPSPLQSPQHCAPAPPLSTHTRTLARSTSLMHPPCRELPNRVRIHVGHGYLHGRR